jgi:hypothetical protein
MSTSNGAKSLDDAGPDATDSLEFLRAELRLRFPSNIVSGVAIVDRPLNEFHRVPLFRGHRSRDRLPSNFPGGREA